MFTGLIQGTGKVVNLEKQGQDIRFRIQPQKPLSALQKGESIAVNGVCLTVEDFSGSWFSVYASPETLSTTNLERIQVGHRVNLERALTLTDRVGGHLVSGHVDCQAEVSALVPLGRSVRSSLRFDPQWSPFVVAKGSVALDGISLTVNACGRGFLEVSIIPVTAGETTISDWKTGTRVNMETDLIGKYVRNMLSAWTESGNRVSSSNLSWDFLEKHGFGT